MNDLLLNEVKEFCKNAIEDANDALENEDITDNSEGIYEGRLELAESLLEHIELIENKLNKEIEARSKLNLN